MVSNKLNILIPVDFSEESINGLSTGIEIAKRGRGEITLFNVVTELEHVVDHYYDSFENTSSAYKIGHEKLENEKSKIEKELRDIAHKEGQKNIPLSVEITTGFYRDALKDYLDKHMVHLIVMGTDGKSTLVEFFTENHTQQSIRISGVPILAVKKHYSSKHFSKLLLGIELKEYSQEAVRSIKHVVDYLGSEVYIVHVKESSYEVKEGTLKKLKKFATQHEFDNYTLQVLKEGEVYQRLEEFASKNKIHIIGSISSGDNLFFRLLFGSDTEQILESSERAVLTVKD